MIFCQCITGVPCVLKAKALLLKLPIITASTTGLTVSSKPSTSMIKPAPGPPLFSYFSTI